MSESRGKVSTLMETNTEIQAAASETTPPTGRFAELQQLVAAMASDFEKFYKDGNKAAGTRVRNSMQELKQFAQNVREEVLTLRNQGQGKEQAQ
jgi:phosphate uptake regulator